MKYTFCVEETVVEEFTVEADSPEEAFDIGREKYHNGEFIVMSANVTNTNAAVYDEKNKEVMSWEEI